MPTIVYLVHGMGCGTADGAPPPAGTDWIASTVAAFRWLADTFALGAPTLVASDATAVPPGSDDPQAVWLVPVSYHAVFDEFRVGATDRAKAARGITRALSDADATRLAASDFAWSAALDVLLWWADRAQTRNRATAMILAAITGVDRLAASIPGATTRRILVSHSLGTAAATAALRDLSTHAVWRAGAGFEAFFTLANVAPFVLDDDDVYAAPLVPGAEDSLVSGAMYNARQECDPIPWLLPWRRLAPANAGRWRADWQDAAAARAYRELQTMGVAAAPNETPAITDVHGYVNYLLTPDVAIPLAGHVRGAAFAPAELATLDYGATWNRLPHLRCQRDPAAVAALRAAVASFVARGVPAAGGAEGAWIPRLLDGMELLASARGRC